MKDLEKIKNIFQFAALQDFNKFGTLLMQQADQRNVAGCCEAILILNLKLKRHFKLLADELDKVLDAPEDYTPEKMHHLRAIHEMAYNLLHTATGHEQTNISDELKRLEDTFISRGWEIPNGQRVLGNHWGNPDCN